MQATRYRLPSEQLYTARHTRNMTRNHGSFNTISLTKKSSVANTGATNLTTAPSTFYRSTNKSSLNNSKSAPNLVI